MENKRDLIVVEDGDVFFGTREQFANSFFSNADDYQIKDWCKNHDWKLEILPSEFKLKVKTNEMEEGWEERRDIAIKMIDDFLDEMDND